MNKNYVMIFAVLIAAIFIVGCTGGNSGASNTDTNTQNTADNTKTSATPAVPEKKTDDSVKVPAVPASSSEKLSMDKLYNYGMVKNFEYRTVAGGVTSNIKYTMTSDSLEGKAAWLQTTEMNSQGANIVVKTWLDKVTYGCLKISSSVVVMGQTMDTPAECPKEGPGAKSTSSEVPQLEYLGTESVTVPAGTYSAKKYSLNNTITYWYDSSVPLPLKVAYGTTTAMELVSYS